MKHAHVDETLLTSERIAPFAILAGPDDDPLPKPTRVGLVWDGDACVEVGIEDIIKATAGNRQQATVSQGVAAAGCLSPAAHRRDGVTA